MAAVRVLVSKRRAILAAALCLGLSAWGAHAAAYDPAPWRGDYAILKKGLERSYANLAWFASPRGGIDLPDLDHRTTAALAAARNDKQAKAVLTAFLKAIPDAHLQLIDPRTAADLAAQDGPDHSLVGDRSSGPCDAYDLAEGLKTDFSLPFDQAGARRLPKGGSPFATGLYDSPDGRRIGLVRIPSFEMRQYPDLCRGAAAQLQRSPENRGVDFDDYVEAGFLQFLSQTLEDLRHRGAQAVLVDVGGNPGGGDSGQIAAGLFAAAPLRSNPIWMVAGPPAAHLLDHQLNVLRAARDRARDPRSRRDLEAAMAVVAGRKAAIPARACDMSWVWRQQRPWAPRGCSNLLQAGFLAGPAAQADWRAYPERTTSVALYAPAALGGMQGRWTGPVYVLVDERTASAAEMFGAILQDNRAGKLVGRHSLGAGCGNQGPYRFIALPRTGASVRVSDCVLIRADGSDEVAGLEPDLRVEGGGETRRATEILARVAADLRKSTPAAAPARDTTPAPR